MAARRRELDRAWIRTASRAVAGGVGGLPEFAAAGTVACYLALPSEVQTQPLIELCRQAGKNVCVPALDPQTGRYGFARLGPDEKLVVGEDRTEQPCAPCWIDPREIDLMFVPGVAFDASGGRLGRGGGCYDALMTLFIGPRIGLAFECQMVEQVPREAHDETVDVIVTEERILKIKHGEG